MHVRELSDQIKRTFNITIRSTEKLRALKMERDIDTEAPKNEELDDAIQIAFKKSTNQTKQILESFKKVVKEAEEFEAMLVADEKAEENPKFKDS